MAKITLKAQIVGLPNHFEPGKINWILSPASNGWAVGDHGAVHVIDYAFDIAVPDGDDLIQMQVQALHAEKEKALAHYTQQVSRINCELANLQCLEMS